MRVDLCSGCSAYADLMNSARYARRFAVHGDAANNAAASAWRRRRRRPVRARCRACSGDGRGGRPACGRAGRASSLAVSIIAASGLSGAQCQGLVGPKMPIVGVPSAAATCSRPESFDTATRGGGERQDGVAQIGAGEVARARVRRSDLGGERLLVRAAEHPDRDALGREACAPARHRRGRPALGRADRAGRKRHHRAAVAGEPALLAPSGDLGGRHLEFRQRPVGAAASAPCGSASAAQRSTMRGSVRSPKRRSLSRPKRASPTKPVRSGMPARNGASADFQVRGMTSAVP